MLAPKRILAFTLVELLVVLAIFGVIMLLSSGMSRRTRDTFVAQQFIKTAVQNSRILRRKSMLISRNSSEPEWVQGIGFRIEKSGTQWKMSQVKAVSKKINNNYFYQSFPTGDPCLEIEGQNVCNATHELTLRKLDGTGDQYLPEGMLLTPKNLLSPPTQADCNTALTILYESINGKLHAYCQIGGINVSMGAALDLKISVKYASGEFYRYYLNLKTNGEINAVPN